MTFYEAAVQVLEREGRPLHVAAITDIALKQELLSHAGKSPEETMQSRLLAMARRKADRKIVATALKTYALVDWGVPEDPVALDLAPDVPVEEPPLRPRERHPTPSPDKVRVSGRGERPRKAGREDEDRRRRKRFPPLAEVAFEVLAQAQGPMAALDLASAARERELVSEDLGAETLLNALREDNRRRAEAGRRPAFSISATGEIALERAAASEAPEREAPPVSPAAHVDVRKEERGPGASRLLAQALDHRRQIQRLLRRRLSELDVGALEKACQQLLEQTGHREVRTIRRGKDGALLTARRREGLVDLRFAVRIARGGRDVGLRDVEELRRDVGQCNAQLGMLLSAADVTREARQEVSGDKGPLVFLWCSDALAERFLEKRLGGTSTTVEVHDLDEDFFRHCRQQGAREDRELDSSRREPRPSDGRRPKEPRPPSPESEKPPAAPVEPVGNATPQAPAETDRPMPQPQAAPPVAVDAAAEERRREEGQSRALAHERIEAAELKARTSRSS